jgi:plastocyanin
MVRKFANQKPEIMRKTTTLLSFLMLLSVGMWASPDTVEMIDNVFVPDTVTITEGDTIVWVNNGSNIHTATSGSNCTENGIWNSGNMTQGETYQFVFDTTGEFPYYCIPHCGIGMTGHVTVESGPVGTGEAFAAAQIELFPNPVGDQLRIDLSNIDGSSMDLQIYDLTGKEVLRQSDVSGNSFNVDTSPLRPGLYVVRLSIDGQATAIEKLHKR